MFCVWYTDLPCTCNRLRPNQGREETYSIAQLRILPTRKLEVLTVNFDEACQLCWWALPTTASSPTRCTLTTPAVRTAVSNSWKNTVNQQVIVQTRRLLSKGYNRFLKELTQISCSPIVMATILNTGCIDSTTRDVKVSRSDWYRDPRPTWSRPRCVSSFNISLSWHAIKRNRKKVLYVS